jgi:hypothetical protein
VPREPPPLPPVLCPDCGGQIASITAEAQAVRNLGEVLVATAETMAEHPEARTDLAARHRCKSPRLRLVPGGAA